MEPIAATHRTPLNLVVGFDATPPAELALDRAIEEVATRGGGTIHVVAVDEEVAGAPPAPAPEVIAAAVEAALARRGRPGLRALVHARTGRAADAILALAAEVEADLIVVGTHGRRGVDRLLVGSVAERVVREARCPVLVARGAGYAAPAPDAPCPDCLARRAATGGAEWACAAHRTRWAPPHRYAYTDAGINRLRPDEWALW
jgi:nucleotide-binding universal stress UspA family protein